MPLARNILLEIGKPFVIENVFGAPIKKDLMLYGTMFGLKVIKHRIFEIHGFHVLQLIHNQHKGKVTNGDYITTAGHGGDNIKNHSGLKDWQNALGINWITDKHMLAEAIPPAYSKYIGKSFLKPQLKNLFNI